MITQTEWLSAPFYIFYLGGVMISNGKNSFVVKNNEELSLVLYGIGQRFYTTPVDGEKMNRELCFKTII